MLEAGGKIASNRSTHCASDAVTLQGEVRCPPSHWMSRTSVGCPSRRHGHGLRVFGSPCPIAATMPREKRCCAGCGQNSKEMQGLKLTFAQARRLFGLRDDICLLVLNTLLRDDLLWVNAESAYGKQSVV
jgi:hypothetical protein